MSSLIGKPLQGGKYKLETVLGRGGFGLTFRAHQNYLDQSVVIKTLNEDHWQAPNLGDLQRQFQDEARRLAMCSHPNVVRVSDFFVEDNLPYMVMDYIPGRSLYDIVIPGNPLPVKAAVSYVTQIGGALQAVHAKGLLHRDVKPQNIMVHAQTGSAILIDFGIARELTQNPAQTHTSIVSEGYAPIEQYLPRAHRSAATDVYGLAATLYTLLTAEIPRAAVLRDRDPLIPIRQLRPDLSAGMVAAIEQGMNIELRDRPQSVGRWLTLLSQKSASAVARTNMQRSDRAQPSMPRSPSEYPTQVVAPAYAPSAASHNSANHNSANRTGATVAVPQPSAYQNARSANAYPSKAIEPPAQPYATPKKGFGCFSFILLSLLVAGTFAAGGFLLSSMFGSVFNSDDPPARSLPEATPTVEPEVIPEPDVIAPIEEIPLEPAPETTEPEATESEAAEPETTEPEAAEPDNVPSPDAPDSAAPPLILEDSGNPTDTPPGDPGEPVPVPGFSPGTEEDQIRDRLGEPTEESSRNGYYTAAYSLVPNRVTLGYVYDEGSTRVRQSEAAFSPASNRLIMHSTLLGMLDNQASKKAVDGLEAVRKGERDRVKIKSGNLTGEIARNDNGYIHIYVQR